jgi:hypothetical protein
MVKLKKSPLPDNVQIETEKDYQTDPVFSLLKNDCHNKCYICEEKEPTGLQVEHRVPHRGNPALKFDWNNLLLSCYHCNHVKGSNYPDTLDCTKVDPEEYINLWIAPELKTRVIVEKIADTDGLDTTINLLDHIYNGNHAVITAAECENLRNKVMEEVLHFQQLLTEYEEEPDKELRQAFHDKIAKKALRESRFAAFKRTIIRKTPFLLKEFQHELY